MTPHTQDFRAPRPNGSGTSLDTDGEGRRQLRQGRLLPATPTCPSQGVPGRRRQGKPACGNAVAPSARARPVRSHTGRTRAAAPATEVPPLAVEAPPLTSSHPRFPRSPIPTLSQHAGPRPAPCPAPDSTLPNPATPPLPRLAFSSPRPSRTRPSSPAPPLAPAAAPPPPRPRGAAAAEATVTRAGGGAGRSAWSGSERRGPGPHVCSHCDLADGRCGRGGSSGGFKSASFTFAASGGDRLPVCLGSRPVLESLRSLHPSPHGHPLWL
ncbi:uncharacterized protein LOC144341096 [Macaca mulatta]